MKAKTFKIVTFSVVGVLLAILLAVNIALSMLGTILTGLLSGGSIDSATRAEGERLAEQIVEEGTVLVENREDETGKKVLPLDATDQNDLYVNVFGWSSANWVFSGSGSGRATNDGKEAFTDMDTDFMTALSKANVSYNEDLYNFYKNLDKRNSAAWNTLHSYDYESCRLIEPSMSDYPSDLLAGAEAYSDVAIVILSRVAGESNDAPLVQYKGATLNATPTDAAKTYLDASDEELALLDYVSSTYKKTIVLINSTNQMNLGFMDTYPELGACLVTGGTGNVGTTGIVNVLYGENMYPTRTVVDEKTKETRVEDNPLYGKPVSPSGKLTDTYVYDFRANSSWANTGNLGVGKYTGFSGTLYPIGQENGNLVPDGKTKPKFTQVSYLDYVEDIYVGYKWYETADQERFWDSSKARTLFGVNGYDNIVQYPFGFGLSYTEFSWKVVTKPDVTNITNENVNKEVTITVEVTNEGDFPAQEVVELYYTPPYTKGGIEKASVNLLAFAKTATAVEPHKSQQLDLTFTPGDMGSYDAHGVKIPEGGWILEAGEYQLSLRTDAHNVKEMDDATISMRVQNDLIHYDEEEAFNIFTNEETADNGISIDGTTTNEGIKYLSRNNFEDTFPTVADSTKRTESTKSRKMDQKLIDSNLYDAADAAAWAAEHADVTMPTLGANNGNIIFDDSGKVPNDLGKLLGADYNNELWDDVLDQISYSELESLALHGYVHEEPIDSVGKKSTASYDGPSQIKSFNAGTGEGIGTGFPNSSVLAQTWNAELAKSLGLAAAKDAGGAEIEGWYAPGVNLHRSPFGGRNYEYYSEDSVLSGIMAAKTVEGSLCGGVYVYVKHIIGYDQETARDSLYCWMTEQALRETYMKPFKIILDDTAHIKMTIKDKDDPNDEGTVQEVKGTAGLMTAYGRIGSCWSGGSEALITHLLREEWHYNGAIITDYADHQDFMNGDQMVRAGGDLWMDGWLNDGAFGKKTNVKDSNKNNAAFVAQLREGAHHVLYSICNAAYVNSVYNLASDDPIVKTGSDDFPLWTIVGVVDAVVIAGCAVWVVFAILKKDKVKASEGADETEGDAEETAEPTETAEPNETTETTEPVSDDTNNDE